MGGRLRLELVAVFIGMSNQKLQNRIYLGKIVHKDESYPGEHDAIVDQDSWDRAQETLAANRIERRSGAHAKKPSLLGGLLFDADGRRLTPSHANKQGRRYRYYVSEGPVQGEGPDPGEGIRLPAREVENAVTSGIARFLENPRKLIDTLATPDDVVGLRQRLGGLGAIAAGRLRDGGPSFLKGAVQAIIMRVELGRNTLNVSCLRSALRQWLIDPDTEASSSTNLSPNDSIQLAVSFTLKRRGVEAKLILSSDDHARSSKPDPALIKAVARAHAWNRKLMSGEVKSIRALAETTGLTRPYVKRLLKLAFLAPDIIQAILAGCQPVDLTTQRLTRNLKIPGDWKEQRVALGFVV